MTRRQLLSSASLAATPFRAQAASKPNILFLMADQHRPDCLGVEDPTVQTPNLDRLAREGARFTAAYSSTPSCTPARSGLLTGLSPWNHGMLGYGRPSLSYPTEMPRVMKAAGYYTFAIGKLHYAPQRNLHGYDGALLDESGRVEAPDFISDYRQWFKIQAPQLNPDATGVGWNDYTGKAYVLPERLHPTTWTADAAVNFLQAYQRPEPFFLKVSFARPHSPYDPPERWLARYPEAPKPVVGPWATRYEPRSWDRPDLWHGKLPDAEVALSRRCYRGSVSFIDEQIGRVLAALEKRGWLENTLIVYTSDHGDMTGDHHLWRKTYAYEASARIPMLLRWPKGMLSRKRGQTIDRPVELRDLLATFADAGGHAPIANTDGRSLLDLARGKTKGWRQWIDLEHDIVYGPENHWNALTDGKTKYIFHARDGEEQLFDLTRDRAELHDLSGDPSHAARLREWRGRMLAHLQPRGEPFFVGGKLALRPKSFLYSPFYKNSPPRPTGVSSG